jgi:membrane protease YdiL (CAAX protease family)
MAYFLIIITSLAAFEEILFRGIGFRTVEERIP